MFETLYKTKEPKTFTDGGEFYQPHIEVEFAGTVSSSSIRYFVREKHGWFDDSIKKPANITVTLSPEEGFETYAEAKRVYDAQVQHRAEEGFRHAWHLDPFEGAVYRYID
jgi:hypothetical protein